MKCGAVLVSRSNQASAPNLRTAMTSTMRVEAADVTVEPIVCQPWCLEGDGHPDALFTADQHCWSEDRVIALTVNESIDGGPASWRDTSDPVAYAMVFLDSASGESTSVCVGYADRFAIRFTPTEARLLAAALLEMAGTAER